MFSDLEASAPPPQHWSWKKITLWFLAALIVCAIAIIAYDEELKPYDDLMPARTSAPDAKTNGYLFLKERWEKRRQAPAADREKFTKMLAGSELWDSAWVEKQLVEANTLAGELKQALLLPEFSTLVFLNLGDLDKDSNTWIMGPFRVFLLEMEVRRRSGDWVGAMAIRKDLQEMVRRYLKGSNSLIALLVASSLHSMLYEDTCRLLAEGKPDAGVSTDLAALWQEEIPIIPLWEEVIKHETLLSRRAIEQLRKGDEVIPGQPTSWKEKVFLKPNKTINGLHQQRRLLLQQSFRISSSLPVIPLGSPPDSPRWLRYLDANYYGKMLLADSGSFWKIMPGVTDNVAFRPRAMRVRIAIHRWQLQHPGQWPATLQELVPEFLPEVPADPWNGQPLRWDPVSRMITAVGSDWTLGPAEFHKERRSWFAESRENPGLRLELPPPLPPKPISPSKLKPKAPKPAAPKAPVTPAPSN